ncbi:hypothetical protein CKK33_08085 [Mucilaginibacter sp. MD40]|nr:hypothetical protein CKK33_08085 [Mucilaginibacter sp. MD40]
MEQSTLKLFRITIPGLISIAVFLIFFSTIKKTEILNLKLIDYTYISFIALIIGTIYHLLEVRNLITNFSHKRIDLNIKHNIINLYIGTLTNNQQQYLYQKNRLKNIFYKIVDNDESLKRKGSLVYFNGLLWTSTADLFIISGFGSVIFLLSSVHFIYVKSVFLNWSLIMLITAFSALFFHIIAYYKHINLSNDQIEYIETHCIVQLNQITNDVLHQMP